jgi:hypothetical protein
MPRHRLLIIVMAANLVAAGMFVTAGPALAQCEAGRQFAAPAPPEVVTIYTAKKILTMERGNPEATAVALAGKRILAVGSLDEVKAALGDVKFTVNDTFQRLASLSARWADPPSGPARGPVDARPQAIRTPAAPAKWRELWPRP